MPGWSPRNAPPWWPANEPWPPRGRHHWTAKRRRFARRVGIIFGLVVLLTVIGAAAVVSALIRSTGAPPLVVFALFVVFGTVLGVAFFVRLMGRVGMPMSDLVTGANRVAGGDFSVRIREAGPPFLRSVAGAFNAMTSRLQEQDQQRRHLMADIAHELRTPLSVMQGRVEGILDGVYPRDDEQLKELLEQTHLLGRLVDDLRTLAHAESGTLTLQREPTDSTVLIGDVLASFGPQAQDAQVALSLKSDADGPIVEVDPLRIREVLTNLVANAIRHTPSGGRVTVNVQHDQKSITIRVVDTGRGIAPDELPKIFDRFYKGSDSRGSGLGLTIARRLVLAHGGEITAASVIGAGTTITVKLPVS